MTSSTKLMVLAMVLSSLLIISEAYYQGDDWDDNSLWLNDDPDPKTSLYRLLYRKRNSQNRFQRCLHHKYRAKCMCDTSKPKYSIGYYYRCNG